MKKILKIILISIVSVFFIGCSIKDINIHENKSKINDLTRKVNSGFVLRKQQKEDVLPSIFKRHKDTKEYFKDYTIDIEHMNGITVVLICDNEKALYEDFSCNNNFIDNDYTNKELECKFHIKEPKCN